VSTTHGAEGLCDREWRFLAVSAALLSSLNAAAPFAGQRLADIPHFKHYAGAIAAIPFFDGSLRGMQFYSEAWIDGDLRAWDMDFWAVCTEADEMLVHIVANRAPAQAKGAFSGFRVSDLRLIAADGRVTAGWSDAVLPR
jgi:hypothetical protein